MTRSLKTQVTIVFIMILIELGNKEFKDWEISEGKQLQVNLTKNKKHNLISCHLTCLAATLPLTETSIPIIMFSYSLILVQKVLILAKKTMLKEALSQEISIWETWALMQQMLYSS